MSLTKTFIENLRPEAKVRRYADGQGLYLNMAVSGSKIWEQRCYYKGGDTYITLGSYPTMSLLCSGPLICSGLTNLDTKIAL